MTRGEISPGELLAELRRLAEELDRTPSMQDMAERGEYAPSTFQSKFGSWNAAVTEAELTPNSRRDPVYADEELLAEIRELAANLDRVPSKGDMRERGSHSPTTYTDRFGTWQNAIVLAGLTPDHRGTKIPEDKLLAALKELAASLGRPPTSTEMDEGGPFSSTTYYRRFGSWDAALDAAGLSRTEGRNTAELSDQELLDEISRMADVLHRPPNTTEMDELGAYSASTYRRRFSSWETALREAGLDPTEHRRGAPNRVSERELLDELRALAADLGRSPTVEEMWKQGSYSPATYRDRYGLWSDALEAAGCEPRRSRKAGVSTRELVRALRELAGTRSHRPQRKEMEENGSFSGMTYYTRFGSWQQALEAAGIVPASEAEPAAVQGYCTVCCEPVTKPLSELASDGRLYCTTCEDIRTNDTIFFEDDVIGANPDEDQVLDRFAALLHDLETYVPDVLFYLHLSIAMRQSGFQSATRDGYHLTFSNDTVEVTSKTDRFRFRTNADVLTKIERRISEVTKRTDSTSSLLSSRSVRKGSVTSGSDGKR